MIRLGTAAPSFPIPSIMQRLRFHLSPAPASVIRVRHTYPKREEITKTEEIAFNFSSILVILSGAFSGVTLGCVSSGRIQFDVLRRRGFASDDHLDTILTWFTVNRSTVRRKSGTSR